MNGLGDSARRREDRHVWRFVLPLVCFLFAPIGLSAEEDEPLRDATRVVHVPAGDTVDRDFFAVGPKIEISGTVNGDVYAFGGDVLIDGTVKGDLLAAAGTVTLSGNVGQDVRMTGGQLTVSGAIGRNLTVAAGDVTLTRSASVEGGVVAAGGDVDVGSPIGSDVTTAGGSVTVSNEVNGDLKAAAGSLRLTSQARVAGDLTYWSGTEASIAKGAAITGEVTRRIPPEIVRPSGWKIFGALVGLTLLADGISFISTLVIGLLMIRFLPRYHETAVSILRERSLASLGLGFATVVVTPILVVALLALVVTIPVALILLASFAIVLYLGRVFSISWFGHAVFRIFGKTSGQKSAFFAGLVIYFVLALIPVLGPVVTLFFVLLGLGTELLTRKEIYRTARNREIV